MSFRLSFHSFLLVFTTSTARIYSIETNRVLQVYTCRILQIQSMTSMLPRHTENMSSLLEQDSMTFGSFALALFGVGGALASEESICLMDSFNFYLPVVQMMIKIKIVVLHLMSE